jgi:hypothetical protein
MSLDLRRHINPMARLLNLGSPIMNDTPIRFASTEAKSKLFAAMTAYLTGKSGPIRPERLGPRLLGCEWNTLSPADMRIVLGTLSRLGFTSGEWPYWYRESSDDAAEAVPAWLMRAAA